MESSSTPSPDPVSEGFGAALSDFDAPVVRALLDVMPGTLHVKDRDLRYCVVNRFYCERWGLPREAFIGKRSLELFNDEHDEQVERRDRHVLETGKALPFYEVEYAMDDGPLALLATKIPLLDATGVATHVLTLGIDITALKEVERALTESEYTRSGIVQSALDAIVAVDVDGRILEFNAAAEQTFGRNREDVLGEQIEQVVIPAHLRHQHLAAMARFVPGDLASRGGRRFETLAMHGDGTEFPVEISVAEIPLESGSVFTAFIRDLTASKSAEAALQRQREAMHQASKLSTMGTLVASIAHELKNPLSVVLGQTVLLEETTEDARVQGRAQRIGRAAERCTRIVRGFLDMARQKPMQAEAVQIDDVVTATLELTRHLLRDSNVALELELAADLPRINADPHQLGQVLMNLIVNAQQALEGQAEPRLIRVISRRELGDVVVAVEDNGPGIAESDLESVFTPFYSTKTDAEGTGLGLAICSDIVAAHGGLISVDSTVGDGTTVSVALPIPATQPDETVVEAGADVAHILVLDDEPDVLEMLTEVLEREGFQVDAFDNAAAALASAADVRYDAVMSDLRMPGMDGRGFFEALVKVRPELGRRFVCVTGEASSIAAERFVASNQLEVLEKPFRPSGAIEVVRRVLARSE